MSPHFGLLDEKRLSRKEALLMRAKLHWRCGRRRIAEHKTSAGIVTVYDAILSAMRWYALTHAYDALGEDVDGKLENDRFLLSLLRQVGLIDDSVDLPFMEKVVNRALLEEDVSAYRIRFSEQAQLLLTRLEVLPFDETALPPEDPDTF